MEALSNLARKVVFYFFLLLLIILPLEIFCLVYLGLSTGQWASANYFFRHHFAQQQKAGCWWADSIAPHPYLSFAYHRGQPCSQEGINEFGLKGPDFPAVNDPEFYDILVLGGSVAELFTAHRTQAPNFLEKRLNERYLSPNGKPFRLLNAAISAGRQPMQLISLTLFGSRTDAVISLEGFNELVPYRLSRPLLGPTLEWRNLMASGYGLAQYGPLFMAKFLANSAADNFIFSHSYVSFLATRLLYSVAERSASSGAVGLDFAEIQFPSGWTEKERRAEVMREYKRVLRLQRAMAKEGKQPYFAFIQPAPALYKRLTDQEKSVVGDLSYGALYQEFTDGILALREEGYPIASLLKILASVDESLYVDNIHFDGEGTVGRGNELLANAIADTLGREWRLQPRK